MKENEGKSCFQPTRWTLVRRAQGESSEARAALSELCDTYYSPVLAFLRRNCRSEDDARELAQEFFSRLLAGANVSGAEPSRGKFRSFLLGAVKHFLSDFRDQANAEKRGGGIEHVPFEGGTGTSPSLDVPQPAALAEDVHFDRQWALTLLTRGIELVERELREAGKVEVFAVLKPWLTGESATLSVGDAAKELKMSEGAVRVAIHRLRQRFRSAVRTEVAQTVDGEEAIASEMSYLVEVLSR